MKSFDLLFIEKMREIVDDESNKIVGSILLFNIVFENKNYENCLPDYALIVILDKIEHISIDTTDTNVDEIEKYLNKYTIEELKAL